MLPFVSRAGEVSLCDRKSSFHDAVRTYGFVSSPQATTQLSSNPKMARFISKPVSLAAVRGDVSQNILTGIALEPLTLDRYVLE